MAFNNVPVNGWPQIKDLEKLNEIASQIENMPTFTSNDKAFLEDLPAYPNTDGTRMLTATTSEGNTSLSYEDIPEELPNYSTTEQPTGQKWFDGNDIYFKTIDIGALPNSTNKDVLTNITNIRDIVRIDGIATNGTIYTSIPHGANIAQYGVEVSYDKTNNYLRVSTSEDQSTYTGVIILYYTKTTT